MLNKIIILVIISIAVSPVFSGLACDAIFSGCMAALKVPTACWTARLACIAACGETGPLCSRGRSYRDMKTLAQRVCGEDASKVYGTCSSSNKKMLSDLIDWCTSSTARKKYGVKSFPGWWC